MDNQNKATEKENPHQESKKTKFSFPNIPHFLKNFLASSQNVIGIDIGSSYIKIVQLQKSAKGYMITNCITRALPQIAKENPAEKRKLTQEFIKEFIADARVKTNLGRIAIWGKGVFVLSLVVPSLKAKDLRGAVSIELKKRLPFQLDINSVSFDFFVTGQTTDESGTNLQVTCFAAENTKLFEETRFLKEMNIRPVAINVIPDALGNLLPFCLEGFGENIVAILDLGASTTLLNFYKGKILIFSREIPVGGDMFTVAMSKSIPNPMGSGTITNDEAEKIKRNCGIPLEDEAKTEYLTDYGAFRGEQVSAMLRPTLERLVVEITRTLSYFSKTFKIPHIEELYMTGGSSRLRNIDKFLLYNLPGLKKVESLNALKAVKGWAETGVFKQELVVEQAAPHLAAAFGLCLGSGGKVNLLPLKEKIEQKLIMLTTLLRISFPALLFFILGYYTFTYTNALNYNVLITKMDGEVRRLDPTVRSIKEYIEIKAKFDQRKGLLDKAKGRQPLWWGIFKELSNITPKDVILEKIITVEDKDPKEIKLVGKIFAKYTIVDLALSQYVTTLEESPYFASVEYSSKPDMFSPVPAANFEITCKINY